MGSTAAGVAAVLGVAVVPQALAVIGGQVATGPATASAVQLTGAHGFLCSGSLVAPQWVVTAAHCVAGTTAIRAGSLTFDEGGQVVKVDQTVQGPDDLGLLHLATPVDAPPIPIATQSPAPGTRATLMGWGQTSNGTDAPPAQQLMALDVQVVAPGTCTASDIDPAHELCIGVTTQASDCFGDSGGPLLVGGLLVGADSRGSSDICGQGGGDVYSDVTTSRAFITGEIGQAGGASGVSAPSG